MLHCVDDASNLYGKHTSTMYQTVQSLIIPDVWIPEVKRKYCLQLYMGIYGGPEAWEKWCCLCTLLRSQFSFLMC